MSARPFPAGLAFCCAAAALALGGCSRQASRHAGAPGPAGGAQVLAMESFLADFARQVAGDRLQVRSLIPPGVDPHEYEPTPQDMTTAAGARMIIANGAGLESFLTRLTSNAAPGTPVVEASAGLAGRTGREGEVLEGGVTATGPSAEVDPHFWLNPIFAVRYVENIRDAFARADPAGADVYRGNAEAYIARLRELDSWIERQVAAIPAPARSLVTNHESLGYFADRYGFRIVGTVIPSVSTEASPTARQIARLIDGLKASGARAVFLETGANPQLARQVAQESGIKVVTELYTHSLTGPSGPAPTYLEMMRFDVKAIVDALAGVKQ